MRYRAAALKGHLNSGFHGWIGISWNNPDFRLSIKTAMRQKNNFDGYPESDDTMKSSSLVILIFVLSYCLVLPCSATNSLQNVTTTPVKEPYPPGIPLTTSADLAIIPAGPTTFIEGYTLMLSTDLDNAGWNVRVMVDGRQAAVFEKTGNTIFLNGYLLSYPVTRDVEVKVTMEGTVPPPGTAGTFPVLRVIELNNQGQAVPESEQTVTRPFEVPVTHSALPPQSESMGEHPVSTAQAGISPVPVIGGLFLVIFLARRRER
jgi:hypothetical protein